MQMANRDVERGSTSGAIREMQIKTARYHCVHTRMAIAKRETIISVDKAVEELEPSYLAGENVKWCRHLEKQFDNPSKG